MLPDMLKNLYTVAETLQTELTRGDFIRFYEEDGRRIDKYCRACLKGMYYKVWDPQKAEPAAFQGAVMTWCGIVRRDFIEKWHIRYIEKTGASYQVNGLCFQNLHACIVFLSLVLNFINFCRSTGGKNMKMRCLRFGGFCRNTEACTQDICIRNFRLH